MSDGVSIDWSLAQPKTNFTDTYANAFQMGRTMAQQQGEAAAGQQFATDPMGGANAMMQFDPAKGLQMRTAAQAAQDRTANIAAATAAAGGDYPGAAKAAAGTGDVSGVMDIQAAAAKMTTQQREQAIQRAQIVAGVLHSVQAQTADPNARLQIVRHIAATSGYGIDPNSITLDDVTDQGIAGHVASAMTLEQQLQQEQKAAEIAETHRHNVADEGKPQYVETKNADGSTSQVLVNPGAVGAAQGTGGAPAAAPAPAAGGLPRGLRNNNPVNVTVLPPGHSWNGQTGTDGDFAVFGSPQAGWDAADRNLQSYAQLHGINTIAGVVNRWAPPSARQDPAAYAARVAQAVGVDPNAPMNMADPGVRQHILTAMAQIEQGQPVAWGAGAPMTSAPAAGSPAAPTIGGTPTRIDSGANATAPGDMSKTGEAYLATLDPATRAMVIAIDDGREATPMGFALTNPRIQGLIAAVAHYDPMFDAANAGARAKTRASITGGPMAAQVVSYNTALGHLDQLDRAIDGLHNGSTTFGNNTVNFWKQHLLGDSSIATFKADALAAATELSKALQGGQPHEAEIKAWLDQLNEDRSPDQLHGTVKAMSDLLASRINELGNQYAQGMGVSRDGMTLLHPEAAATLARLGGQNGAEARAKAAFYQAAEARGMPARQIDGAWERFAAGKTFGGPTPGRPAAPAPATRPAAPPARGATVERHYNPATGRLE